MCRSGRALLVVGALFVGFIAGCGEDQGPQAPPLTVAKPAIKSGDQQTGPVGLALGNPLRVLITQDGEPVEDVSVTWSAGQGGSLADAVESGEDGIATAVWTLGSTLGEQVATATIDGADGSPLSYTAVATDEPEPPGPTVRVLGPGEGNRFEPTVLSITAGQTVTWLWSEESAGHNVVPDDGVNPAPSGPLADAPQTYSFTFETAGLYRYYCQAHGGPAGVGMSGRIIVQP